MGIFDNPLLAFAGPALGGFFQQQQSDAANAAIQRLQGAAFGESGRGYDEANAILSNLRGNTAATGRDLVSGFQGMEADALKMSDENRAAGVAGYGDLLKRVLGEMDGLGNVEHGRIDRNFNNAESAGMQDLIDRGMLNSSNLPSLRVGTARDRSEAHGALAEQLRRERSGAIREIGGNAMNFLVNNDLNKLGTMLNARGNTLGAVDTANTRNLGVDQQAFGLSRDNTGQRLGILQAPYAIPQGPPPPNWGDVFQSGFNNWTAYRAANQQPQGQSIWPGLISGGTSLGGSLGGAGIIAGALG